MPLQIFRQDITQMDVDAIVNSSNEDLIEGYGVSSLIYKHAGRELMEEACLKIGYCDTGQAVITPGFGLKAKYVIHTVGPYYDDRKLRENNQLLNNAYLNSLKLAYENKCRSIAFPLISSGTYRYPKDLALQIALGAIQKFLLEYEMEVYLTVFDEDSFVFSKNLYSDVKQYIDENYVTKYYSDKSREKYYRKESSDSIVFNKIDYSHALLAPEPYDELMNFFENKDKTFSEILLSLIDMKGLTDVVVYNRANMTRQLFSKIRTNNNYKPSKKTALALAIALQLNVQQTNALLSHAGFILSRSDKFDLAMQYFIENEIFDIHKINIILHDFKLSTL